MSKQTIFDIDEFESSEPDAHDWWEYDVYRGLIPEDARLTPNEGECSTCTCGGTGSVIIQDDYDGLGRYQPVVDECPDCAL